MNKTVQSKNILLDKTFLEQEIYNIIKKHIIINVLDTIDSTNTYLHNSNNKEEICIAEYQSNGRGRTDNNDKTKIWISPHGKNVCLSYKYTFTNSELKLEGFSIVIGLATISAIQDFIKKFQYQNHKIFNKLKLKWPNDLMVEDSKLGGILIEIQKKQTDLIVIIGIGINTNLNQKEIKLNRNWTSLSEILNTTINRNEFIPILLFHLLNYIKIFENHNGFSEALKKEYKNLDYLSGKKVTLKINKEQKINGIILGVNDIGNIQILTNDGAYKTFSSTEITKIYY